MSALVITNHLSWVSMLGIEVKSVSGSHSWELTGLETSGPCRVQKSVARSPLFKHNGLIEILLKC